MIDTVGWARGITLSFFNVRECKGLSAGAGTLGWSRNTSYVLQGAVISWPQRRAVLTIRLALIALTDTVKCSSAVVKFAPEATTGSSNLSAHVLVSYSTSDRLVEGRCEGKRGVSDLRRIVQARVLAAAGEFALTRASLCIRAAVERVADEGRLTQNNTHEIRALDLFQVAGIARARSACRKSLFTPR